MWFLLQKVSILQKLNLKVLKQKHPWSSLLWRYLYILVLFPVFPYCKLRPGTGPGPGPAPPPAPPQPQPLVCAKKSHDLAPGCCRPLRLPAPRPVVLSSDGEKIPKYTWNCWYKGRNGQPTRLSNTEYEEEDAQIIHITICKFLYS